MPWGQNLNQLDRFWTRSGGSRASSSCRNILPEHSPDLNLIEQVFAKFKTLLRKAGACVPTAERS